MKHNIFTYILFILLTIPMVFLAAEFYLGAQEQAIKNFNNDPFYILFGRLIMAGVVSLIITIFCLLIDLIINHLRRVKTSWREYLRKGLYMMLIGISYAAILKLIQYIQRGYIS